MISQGRAKKNYGNSHEKLREREFLSISSSTYTALLFREHLYNVQRSAEKYPHQKKYLYTNLLTQDFCITETQTELQIGHSQNIDRTVKGTQTNPLTEHRRNMARSCLKRYNCNVDGTADRTQLEHRHNRKQNTNESLN